MQNEAGKTTCVPQKRLNSLDRNRFYLITALCFSAPYSNFGSKRVVRLWAGRGPAFVFRTYYMLRQTSVGDLVKSHRDLGTPCVVFSLYTILNLLRGSIKPYPQQGIINPPPENRQKTLFYEDFSLVEGRNQLDAAHEDKEGSEGEVGDNVTSHEHRGGGGNLGLAGN